MNTFCRRVRYMLHIWAVEQTVWDSLHNHNTCHIYHIQYGVVHKLRHTLTGGGGHQICDKLWQGGGGVSSFVMSHESFWYACYRQSYQKGKVWRPKCFYSIYNSFLLQPMRKFCRYCQWINCFCSIFPIVSQSLDLQLIANYIVVLSM